MFAGVLVVGAPGGAGPHAAPIPPVARGMRSAHRYIVPPVVLMDQHDRPVRLDQALAGNRPVLVQFFFTTCTTICDMRSAQLVAIAPDLARAGVHIGFYTISIDPDHDTPQRLLAYSKQFGQAPPSNWHLLTGSDARIKQVQAAFDASDPSADRMMHKPLTFIRGGRGKPWIRIDEMLSARQLMQQIELAVDASSAN